MTGEHEARITSVHVEPAGTAYRLVVLSEIVIGKRVYQRRCTCVGDADDMRRIAKVIEFPCITIDEAGGEQG